MVTLPHGTDNPRCHPNCRNPATQKVFWRPHPDSSSDTRKAESKSTSSALTHRRLSESVTSCIFFRHSKIIIYYFFGKFK